MAGTNKQPAPLSTNKCLVAPDKELSLPESRLVNELVSLLDLQENGELKGHCIAASLIAHPAWVMTHENCIPAALTRLTGSRADEKVFREGAGQP